MQDRLAYYLDFNDLFNLKEATSLSGILSSDPTKSSSAPIHITSSHNYLPLLFVSTKSVILKCIPTQLTKLKHLTRLTVNYRFFGDRQMSHVMNSPLLTYLDITGTRVTSDGLAKVSLLALLSTLKFSVALAPKKLLQIIIDNGQNLRLLVLPNYVYSTELDTRDIEISYLYTYSGLVAWITDLDLSVVPSSILSLFLLDSQIVYLCGSTGIKNEEELKEEEDSLKRVSVRNNPNSLSFITLLVLEGDIITFEKVVKGLFCYDIIERVVQAVVVEGLSFLPEIVPYLKLCKFESRERWFEFDDQYALYQDLITIQRDGLRIEMKELFLLHPNTAAYLSQTGTCPELFGVDKE